MQEPTAKLEQLDWHAKGCAMNICSWLSFFACFPGLAAAQCAMPNFDFTDCDDNGYWLAADIPNDDATLDINGLAFGNDGQIILSGTSTTPERMSGFTNILSAQGRVLLQDNYSLNDGLSFQHLVVRDDMLFQFGRMMTGDQDRVLFLARQLATEDLGGGRSANTLIPLADFIYEPALAAIINAEQGPSGFDVMAVPQTGGIHFGQVDETGEFPSTIQISPETTDLALSDRVGDRLLVATDDAGGAWFEMTSMPSSGLAATSGEINAPAPDQQMVSALLGCEGEAYFLFSDQHAYDPDPNGTKEEQITTALHRVTPTGEVELRAGIPQLRQRELSMPFAPNGLEIMGCGAVFSWGAVYDEDGTRWPAAAVLNTEGNVVIPMIWYIEALRGGALTRGRYDFETDTMVLAGTFSDRGYIVVNLPF